MTGPVDALRAARERQAAYEVTFEGDGAKRKLKLPPPPAVDDVSGQCQWLTSVFNLDAEHPIKSGAMLGVSGPDGHVVLGRVAAPELRFEPARHLNTPSKLIEELSWRMLPSDGAIHAFQNEHCRQITHVVRMLCSATETLSANQEAKSIVGAYLMAAELVEGFTTHGNGSQRYEAAVALRRGTDQFTGRATRQCKYLIDATSGEVVIAVNDLNESARKHTGSGLRHGWLEGRMDGIAWKRITLDGHALAGRAGRQGEHARIDAYRGRLDTAPSYNDINGLEVAFSAASAPIGVAPAAEM